MEEWIDIKGFEWLYQVSDLGRIKSFKRRWIWKTKILKLCKTKKWYIKVGLSKKCLTKSYLVHRLVAIHFIPNTENKPEVNHILWNKWDNRACMLEWNTKSENELHKYKVLWNNSHFLKCNPSLWKFWKDNKSSKKVNQYDLAWNFIKLWYSIADVNRDLKIAQSNVSKCCKWERKSCWGYRWKFTY